MGQVLTGGTGKTRLEPQLNRGYQKKTCLHRQSSVDRTRSVASGFKVSYPDQNLIAGVISMSLHFTQFISEMEKIG